MMTPTEIIEEKVGRFGGTIFANFVTVRPTADETGRLGRIQFNPLKVNGKMVADCRTNTLQKYSFPAPSVPPRLLGGLGEK